MGGESKIFKLTYFIGLTTFGKLMKRGLVNKNFFEKECYDYRERHTRAFRLSRHKEELLLVFFDNLPYSFTLFLRRFCYICVQDEVPPSMVG